MSKLSYRRPAWSEANGTSFVADLPPLDPQRLTAVLGASDSKSDRMYGAMWIAGDGTNVWTIYSVRTDAGILWRMGGRRPLDKDATEGFMVYVIGMCGQPVTATCPSCAHVFDCVPDPEFGGTCCPACNAVFEPVAPAQGSAP